MAEEKEKVSHLDSCAVALPTAVFRFVSLSSLESRFFEVGDFDLSLLLSLENSECSTYLCMFFLLESCSKASVVLVRHRHWAPGLLQQKPQGHHPDGKHQGVRLPPDQGSSVWLCWCSSDFPHESMAPRQCPDVHNGHICPKIVMKHGFLLTVDNTNYLSKSP